MNEVGKWLAPLLIALGSLVVAIISLVKSGRTEKRSGRTEKRMLAIEEQREQDRVREAKRAKLVARLVRGVENYTYYLEVENKGEGEAREIELLVDEVAVSKHHAIHNIENEVQQVGPLSSFRYVAIATSAGPLPREVQISWTDDSGEGGEYKTTLT